ncbi:putative transcription factor FAR family [Helianthus annuus]|uniref:protein FAR1-RELATED SEQUENCE 8 isoform X2 n=1 Tax=Helianthus annuus TaxID=4232 RepID=UPI000B8EFBB8|nr:protein FAR1-RELATED SEQUENCE 8 isoform X2 [Helianthus annuus]KAJ0442514.1 putative transcription factor FAR family [Helianthus annuus]KAJ0835607.1 putative transcription factor FAR family [Helianthus annuus]
MDIDLEEQSFSLDDSGRKVPSISPPTSEPITLEINPSGCSSIYRFRHFCTFVDGEHSEAKLMDSRVQPEKEALESNLIDDIDANGYLVVHSDSDVEVEDIKDFDMDFEFEKEVNDDVIGQVFDTLGDAYDFYNRYAFVHGFGIRIRSTFKDKTTNEPYRRKYVCNKEGFKDLKRDSSKGDVKRRRDLRTGCEAFLRISKEACKSLMSELSQSRLKPSQIRKVVNTMKSPCENDVTKKVGHYISSCPKKKMEESLLEREG